MLVQATQADFEWLFSIAKAYGLSFENCRDVIRVELNKSIGELTRKEVIEFGRRICGADHEEV